MWRLAMMFLLAMTATSFAQVQGAKVLVQRRLGEAANAAQQAAAETVKTEIVGNWVEVPIAGEKAARLYVVWPKTEAREVPALIVLQEWWGVNDDIKARTFEFAGRGFVAIAADLYDGQSTDDPKKAAELKSGLKDDRTMKIMQAAIDYARGVNVLEKRPHVVDEKRIGVIGWCMGGREALRLATTDDRVKAVATFYGGGMTTKVEDLRKLQGPLLGIFGNTDKNPSPRDVDALEAALKEAGKTDVEIHRYDGVGHAFASESARKVGLYNEEKAKEAWAKTWVWLEKKLLTPAK